MKLLWSLTVLSAIYGAYANPAIKLAADATVTASSTEKEMHSPEKAADGNAKTRWASKPGDAEWIMLDLGKANTVGEIRLDWETAAGKEYTIQFSLDGNNFTNVFHVIDGKPGDSKIIRIKPQKTRFIRIQGIKRATQFGYSLWEIRVYGDSENSALFRPAKASSMEREEFPPEAAVDGNPKTRWASAHNDNENLTVDLGGEQTVGRIVLNWEKAAGKEYSIQFSPDGKRFSEVYRKLDGQPEAVEEIRIKPRRTRYIRIQGIKRTTQFGYSVRELEAYQE